MRSSLVPVALLAIAVILGLFVTISLPSVHFFDVVRVSVATGGQHSKATADSIRWGIWGACYENTGSNHFSCKHFGVGYDVTLGLGHTIGASYTRGLVVHAIAFGCTVVALGLAFSETVFMSLLASLVSFLAALLSLIAMAIDIALYLRVHSQSNDVPNVRPNTDFGPAFWMTLIATVACLGAGATICTNRRKGADTYSYPMLERGPWYRRFRRG